MEFVQEIKGYCEKEEEQVMEEERGNYKKLPFVSNSSSSPSSSSSKCKGPKAYDKFQRLWFESEEEAAAARSYDRDSASALEFQGHQEAFNFNTKLEVSDLSLRNSDEATTDGTGSRLIKREHMFDKVVTPSDVGKLNRLVIPKQHAEKYFPLNSSSNEKGLLLNFEDRNGKQWRFRYSYWNSSQSYVMTKGWSRFVKEKKLVAGDIVSFERGIGELGMNHLYIDWRRRPDALVSVPQQFQNQIQPFPRLATTVRWGRLNSLPQSMPSSISPISPQVHQYHLQPQQLSYNIHPYHRHHYYHHQNHQRISYNNNSTHDYSVVNSGSPAGSHYYLRSQVGGHDHGDVSMVIDSVPVVHGKATTAKRLRLFGVNMECAIPEDPECDILSSSTTIPHVTMASLSRPHHIHHPSPQLKVYNGAPLPTAPPEFVNKGKGSLSFDLDL